MRLNDLTGKEINNIKIIHRASSNRRGGSTWICKCHCGVEFTTSSDHLTRKKSPIKSCGCTIKKKGSSHKDWKGHGEISGDWWYSHVLRERKQTDRVRVPVTITIEYAWNLFIKQNKKCSLSGLPLIISNTSKYSTASIDRIDSSKGYEEGNIQWVHKDINFMKRMYSQEYFIAMCNKVAYTNPRMLND